MSVEIVLRVFPKSSEVGIDELVEKIKEKVSPEKIEKEPLAFGLFAVKVHKVVEEKEGEAEKIEKEIKEIEGVGECQIISLTRLL